MDYTLLYTTHTVPRKTRRAKEKAARDRARVSSSDMPGIPSVKGEFEFKFSSVNLSSKKLSVEKNNDNSLRFANIGTIKGDLIKTVVLALIILGVELVIYSRWFI
ncbi:MAG: hypothetical protein Q7S79_01300 [bacterium]|nr:hypothetical protein [bacterium]